MRRRCSRRVLLQMNNSLQTHVYKKVVHHIHFIIYLHGCYKSCDKNIFFFRQASNTFTLDLRFFLSSSSSSSFPFDIIIFKTITLSRRLCVSAALCLAQLGFCLPLLLVLVHADAAGAEGDHHQEATNHGKGLKTERKEWSPAD